MQQRECDRGNEHARSTPAFDEDRLQPAAEEDLFASRLQEDDRGPPQEKSGAGAAVRPVQHARDAGQRRGDEKSDEPNSSAFEQPQARARAKPGGVEAAQGAAAETGEQESGRK